TRRCAGASAEHAQKIAAVNLGFVVLFHRYSSLGTRSQRQRKRVRFDFNENTAHSAYWLVEFRGLRTFEIGEEAPPPSRNVVLEDRGVPPLGRRQVAAGETGHDLAQDAGVIFRLGHAFGARNAEPAQILTQARQRPFVQEAGNVIRGVRQKLAAADSNEEAEVFTLHVGGVRACGGFSEVTMRGSGRRGVALQLPELL